MKINLDTFLPYQLTNIATLVSNDFAKVYKREFGLNIPQWRILANLAQYGQSTAKQLCTQADMDKSTVSRAVKALIEKQLISSKTNQQDKRAALLMLNEQGKQLYADIATQALEWEQQFLSELSCDEYLTLMRCFDKLTIKLQQ
ncbi:MarR family winged helix-turn-helix transcriptional regulator [Pseudoalteromonas sp. SR45-4]|uniref:MarR family winged helix-turn-helix transcriptional regulator n=1 Tax=Pseudoalteromonas sp. SR45-4 TaxID=2760929 RepID=UPI0015F8FEF4|nr:MarR family transcriptional regulator [Pseudoalteromonas sp. SR45-4]MBB1371200.1 MarR family transcriptional regulator [Pseudoalteromonas sp. SR45-4]